MKILNSSHGSIRAILAATVVLLATACGGGGSGDEPGGPPAATPPLQATPEISWFGTLSEPQSRTVVLETMVPFTLNATKQVDFFVDGVLTGTTVFGAKQPGVPLATYGWSWNTATYSDGPHTVTARVTDSAGLTAETPTRTVLVANNDSLPISLSPGQIFPAPSSAAMGTGQLSVNVATGAIAGDVLLTNMTASAVHLHSGWPTTSGPSIITFVYNPTTQRWVIPADAVLTSFGSSTQVNDLLAGRLYLDAHSTLHPAGEIRAQVLSRTMSLAFAELSGDQELPPVNSQGRGIVSILENRSTQRFQINARTMGLDNVVSIGVYSRSGPASQSNWLYFLRPDADGVPLVSDRMATPGYNAGTWYMNVTTGQHTSGEIGGAVPLIAPKAN